MARVVHISCCAGGYNDSFRARFRNVHFNLKDDKNQDFRGKVLRGEVQPIKLLRMNVTDMASEVRLPCPALNCPSHALGTVHSPII